MATTWIRVRDTRTDDILPNPVPLAWLDKFEYLQEVPSSKAKRQVGVTEPVQPPQLTPDTVDITEPEKPTAAGRNTPINGKKDRNA